MRALIFAAGRGERMRPLTDTTPKPLLEVRGKPLIVWHLEKLAAAGVHYVVINTSYLAEEFPASLGDGARFGLRIRYAYEGDTALETGGGMLNALPLLGSAPFITVSADIYTDADYAALPAEPAGLAHLLLTDNPAHHPDGDFALDDAGHLLASAAPRLTWTGIGVFRPAFLDGWQVICAGLPGSEQQPPRFKLRPLLDHHIATGTVTGQQYHGIWNDVGTPERLLQIETSANLIGNTKNIANP
ncbi:MAG TPA: nucleotidyltransferase family protein [Rhodanobacteraceae bacterium]|nr:nucleotidyltransferase family protein [Rhodanobacteraceae bacterium]